jgi:hypothetical protein
VAIRQHGSARNGVRVLADEERDAPAGVAVTFEHTLEMGAVSEAEFGIIAESQPEEQSGKGKEQLSGLA